MIKSEKTVEILLIFLAVYMLHDYYLYKSTPKKHVLNKKPKFTPLEPFDLQTEHREFNIDPSRLVDLTNFTFLINPDVCKNERILLIIVVSSDPANYDNRMAIRETWGGTDDAVKIVFTFGVHKNPELAKKVTKESAQFGDIVQGNFLDDYRNLTYKHVMGLQWTRLRCAGARYLFKSDDDTFVHRRALLKFLVRELSPWGTQNLIAGLVWHGMPVLRTNETKWYVRPDEFTPDEYPPYCSGMAMIYSQDVIPFLVEASETTKYLFVDDAFVTGILAEKARIPRSNIQFLYHNWDHNKKLLEEGVDAINEFVWGPCNVGPKKQRDMWRLLNQ